MVYKQAFLLSSTFDIILIFVTFNFQRDDEKKKTWEAAGNVHVLGCDRLEQFLADKVKINIDIQLVINIKLIAEEEVSQDTLFSQDVLLRSRSTTNC